MSLFVGDKQGNCWKCGNSLSPAEYGRRESCPRCGIDTHVCRNCKHHDRSYNNECRENQADRVVDKEKANFCDHFDPKSGGPGGADPNASKNALKAAAEALFKKK